MIRVCYVDDDPDFLELTRLFLEEEGIFSIDTHPSPRTALEKIGTGCYDVIVSDYQMCGTNGISFLKVIRERHGSLPFILFTGRADDDVMREAFRCGADYCHSKIGDPTELYSELAYMIRYAVRTRSMENALHRNHALIAPAIIAATDLISVIGTDGRFSYTCPAHNILLGYPAGSLLGKDPLDFIHPEDRGWVRQDLVTIVRQKQDRGYVPLRFRSAAGLYIGIECSTMNRIDDPDVHGLVVLSRKQKEPAGS